MAKKTFEISTSASNGKVLSELLKNCISYRQDDRGAVLVMLVEKSGQALAEVGHLAARSSFKINSIKEV